MTAVFACGLFLTTGCPGKDRFELLEVVTSGSGVGAFDRPMGIDCATPEGAVPPSILIADYGNDRVVSIPFYDDARATHTYSFGSGGTGPGEFRGPTSLSVTFHDDNESAEQISVYVTDTRNNRIQQFDLSGNFIRMWGLTGEDSGQFRSPLGITTDVFHNVYVVDSGNCRIQVFDSTGGFIRQWGSAGTGPGQFLSPIDISAINDNVEGIRSTPYVVVTDYGNNRIQCFTTDGEFVRQFNGIAHPLGICSEKHVIEVSCESCRGYWAGGVESGLTFVGTFDLNDPYDIALNGRWFTEPRHNRLVLWLDHDRY